MKDRLRVVITGATSGLGRAMALELARQGARVAVTGRRPDMLRDTARLVEEGGGQCLALHGGVTDLSEVRRHYDTIARAWGGLDWAILNAGMSDTMNAREFKAELCHRTFAVNVGGVANWLEVAIPPMIAQGHGTIAGIASVAAFRGLPNGAYSASKAALVTLLESVRVDLRGTGVSVVTVCPGYVKSEMTAGRNQNKMPFLLETDDGARRILDGIEKGKRLVHFPWPLSLPARVVLPLIPAFLYERVIGYFMLPKK